MPVLLNNVKYPEGLGGRTMGSWTRGNGGTVTGLLEWTIASPRTFGTYIADVQERIPTEKNFNHPEEIHTLKIDGLFREGQRTAVVYQCSKQPANLREVLLQVKKPSAADRGALARIIATQVRSLHVHFQLQHTALRTESFVFFGDAGKPNLSKPYVLDWARSPPPDMYRHPEYEADKPVWFYQVWSLLMVLSEIAEWRPLDGESQDERELLKKKLERKRLVMRSDWKGAATAKFFQYGFDFLDRDRATLERYSHWEVKRFYDRLCQLLA